MNSTAHHSVLKQLEIYHQRNPEKVSELSTIKQSGYSSIYKNFLYNHFSPQTGIKDNH